MIKEALYKDIQLKTLSGEDAGYTLRPFKKNKKSVSCKIAKNGNFDPCVKPQAYKIDKDRILFVNYFKSVPLDDLELKYE